MTGRLLLNHTLLIMLFTLWACSGLRYSQVSDEAKNFSPKRIAVFPAEVAGNNEEAKGAIEQIVAGVLSEKKWFANIVDTQSLNRQMQASEELRGALTEYLGKLRTVNFSDANLSKKIADIANVDSFLIVYVDVWNYTEIKNDKVAKVSLVMRFYDAATGKVMWRAGHQIADSYVLIKPNLSDVARRVVLKMVDYMPR